MFSKLGAGEIILIVVVALVIFGPKKLPELGRSLGKSIREFRGAMKEMTGDAKEVVDDVKKTVAEADPRN